MRVLISIIYGASLPAYMFAFIACSVSAVFFLFLLVYWPNQLCSVFTPGSSVTQASLVKGLEGPYWVLGIELNWLYERQVHSLQKYCCSLSPEFFLFFPLLPNYGCNSFLYSFMGMTYFTNIGHQDYMLDDQLFKHLFKTFFSWSDYEFSQSLVHQHVPKSLKNAGTPSDIKIITSDLPEPDMWPQRKLCEHHTIITVIITTRMYINTAAKVCNPKDHRSFITRCMKSSKHYKQVWNYNQACIKLLVISETKIKVGKWQGLRIEYSLMIEACCFSLPYIACWMNAWAFKK